MFEVQPPMRRTAEDNQRLLAELDAARRRLSEAERRMLELMLHKVVLQRLGKDAGGDETRRVLEDQIADLRVELEFAEQRVMFTRPRLRDRLDWAGRPMRSDATLG
jgi:hypothetical protein